MENIDVTPNKGTRNRVGIGYPYTLNVSFISELRPLLGPFCYPTDR